MAINRGYLQTEDLTLESEEKKNKGNLWIHKQNRKHKVYTYDEAIDLTGNGLYSISLLIVMSAAMFAMTIDIFGFCVIVTGCNCDFELGLSEKSILLCVPIFGCILMAYPWGYLSDIKGRRWTLLFGMFGSFIATTISVFSVDWIMLAVFKLISASLCSIVQTAAFPYLGESIESSRRGYYLIIMGSLTTACMLGSVVPGYFVLNLDFALDLGIMTFTSWRLLVFIMGLPLGIVGILLMLYYESPKFLLSLGRKEEALNTLSQIFKWNGGIGEYPVKELILNEESSFQRTKLPLLKSMWYQIVPLFKPPFLLKTLQLCFIMGVSLSCHSSLFVWAPTIAEAFYKGMSSSEGNGTDVQGLCNVITSSQSKLTGNGGTVACLSTLEYQMVWLGIAHSCGFTIMNVLIAKLAKWKRMFTIVNLAISCVSAICAVVITDRYNITSLIFFFGSMTHIFAVSVILSYCVEMYPTAYRSMASCLTLMVGRIWCLVAIKLVGSYVLSNCLGTFYTMAAVLFSGVLVAYLLPSDAKQESTKEESRL